MTTDAPRTDEALVLRNDDGSRMNEAAIINPDALILGQMADLARTLERELAAKSAECQRLREALQGIVSAQALFFDHPDRRISLELARAALRETQP